MRSLLVTILLALVFTSRAEETRFADEPVVIREEAMPWQTPPAYEALRGRTRSATEFPTLAKPWDRKKLGPQYDALEQECKRLFALSADEVRPHPAAESFPGLLEPGAVPVKRTLHYSLGRPDARGSKVILSTGLYAPPGEIIEITGLTSPQPIKVSVRINLQHNNQNNPREHPRDGVERMPIITQRVPLKGSLTRVANPFGGMIYLEVPATAGEFTVMLAGAIPAPRFVLGETDVKAWQETIREYPAPWAELRSRHIILTLSSRTIRHLDDPRPVLETWDKILDAAAELVARPEAERWPPERIVFEALTWGAHSGYPMIVYQARETNALDFKITRMIGMLHELGHNYQSSRWTEPATVEVTCNLVRFYICERVLGRSLDDTVFNWKRTAPQAARHLASDAPFNGRTPSQYMFLKLANDLGWQTYVDAFGALAEMDAKAVPTETNAERRLLVRQLSVAAKRDLRPYFTVWRFIANSTEDAEIDVLPVWLPEPDWPKSLIARYPSKE